MRELKNILSTPVLTFGFIIALFFGTVNYVIAALPYSNAVKTSLIETLKSVTSNVSSTVEDQVNKMISDTMDITISDAMGKLENATIYGNRDTSTIKFEPKVPTGIDISNR
jgi:hypothetical protein